MRRTHETAEEWFEMYCDSYSIHRQELLFATIAPLILLTLQTLLADYPNTAALRRGELHSPLVNFAFADVKTANKAFKRLVRQHDLSVRGRVWPHERQQPQWEPFLEYPLDFDRPR